VCKRVNCLCQERLGRTSWSPAEECPSRASQVLNFRSPYQIGDPFVSSGSGAALLLDALAGGSIDSTLGALTSRTSPAVLVAETPQKKEVELGVEALASGLPEHR